jgi:hypothetical protein
VIVRAKANLQKRIFVFIRFPPPVFFRNDLDSLEFAKTYTAVGGAPANSRDFCKKVAA